MHLLASRARWSTLLLAMCFSSCVFPGLARVPRRETFDEAAFSKYGAPGSSSVVGQLIVNAEKQIHPGDGAPMTLVPVNAYTREMVDRELGDGTPLTVADPRLKNYVRRTKTDHTGNFEFHQVPAGEYFVVGVVEWDQIAGDKGFNYQWGCERIEVAQGQTVRLQVSHDPTHPNVAIYPANSWTAD